MKKYFYLLVAIWLFAACTKKNDPAPSHSVSVQISNGVNPKITVSKIAGGKTTQIFNGYIIDSYSFTVPVGTDINIVAEDEPINANDPIMELIDNGSDMGDVAGVQNNGKFDWNYTFTVK